jgi:hypothetical protein
VAEMPAWLLSACLALFGLSVLTLALSDVRLIRKSGWFALRKMCVTERWWDNLSTQQRLLIIPGMFAFACLVAVAVLSLVRQAVR